MKERARVKRDKRGPNNVRRTRAVLVLFFDYENFCALCLAI